ncbi:hypothetical protein [Micromonospora sp. RTGN7]|uniref:hypothetical protein n=1 Tax=Micromonospora sp. RTGN7 TaxID=3016526 RepID=UPI0029FEFF7D|nr:hypothetical protein [Micromonospora sp. RTGN7]
MAATGYTGQVGGGDGGVASVNGQAGAVVLDAGDVGAEPSGAAATAVSAHAAATDPHGDRAYAAGLAAGLLPRAASVAGDQTVTVNRPPTGAEQADVWQAQYAGARGMYANGYGCARARVPNHADAADQYAFRAQCHSSKDGTGQPIGSFANSANVDQFHTRANGDSYAARDLHVGRGLVFDSAPAWLAVTLGTGVTWAGAPYPTPASQLGLLDRVHLKGRISWAATIGSGATLLILDAAHKPTEVQTFSVRTGAPSNLAAILTIDTAGVVVLAVSTGNAGYLGLDGLNFYRGAS